MIVYKCGYCKKETEITYEEFIKYTRGSTFADRGKLHDLPESIKTPCSCKHFSYCTSIIIKADQ